MYPVATIGRHDNSGDRVALVTLGHLRSQALLPLGVTTIVTHVIHATTRQQMAAVCQLQGQERPNCL